MSLYDEDDDSLLDEISEWETYCEWCGGVVALDAKACPECATADFDPADFGDGDTDEG
jgi:hypothetical protein